MPSFLSLFMISACIVGCPAGTYSINNGKESICRKCARGSTSKAGSSTCYEVCENPSTQGGCCPAGYFSLPNHQDECFPCAPGTFSSFGTLFKCEVCKEGEYQPASASSSCLPCKAGSSSGIGATSCVEKEKQRRVLKEEEDEEKEKKVHRKGSFWLWLLRGAIRGINSIGCLLAFAGIISVWFRMDSIPHTTLRSPLGGEEAKLKTSLKK